MNTNAIYNLNDIPLFTYGMIGVATLGLALITMNIENDSFAKDDGYEKIKSKKTGGDLFGFTTPENKGPEETNIFGNIFTSSSQPKKEETNIVDSILPSKSSEETNLSDNITLNKKGGKYNKTKHNKKHSVYTRKR
jgi:hypothetical protein